MDEFRDYLNDALDRIELAYEGRNPVESVPTGFLRLDELTGGLDGRRCLVRAGNGVGGTTLGLHLALQFLRSDPPIPVVFVSADLSAAELSYRILAAVSGVAIERLMAGALGDDNWRALSAAYAELTGLPLHIVDVADVNLVGVRRLVHNALLEHRGDVCVVVDSVDRIITDRAAVLAGELADPHHRVILIDRRLGGAVPMGWLVLDLEGVDDQPRSLTIRGGLGAGGSDEPDPCIPLDLDRRTLRLYEVDANTTGPAPSRPTSDDGRPAP